MRQQERCRLLLRRMILPGVSEQEKQHIYDQYKAQLIQYDVSLLILGT